MTRWADICCGSGALTLELLSHGRVASPAAYLGGKGAYATSIIRLMGGYSRPSRVTLCDAGPWGWWWRMLLVERQGPRIVRALTAMASRPERGAELHTALCRETPADEPARAAAFIALQASAARGKPVVALAGGRWQTAGYAHLSDGARRRGFSERLRPGALAQRVARILSIQWPAVEVVTDAWAVEPAPGRLVLDPPYLGTTGYSVEMPRDEVCALARRHADAGALVGVCEAEPLGLRPSPLVGWTSTRVRRAANGWQRRLADTAEWLTTSAEPRPPQLALWAPPPVSFSASGSCPA